MLALGQQVVIPASTRHLGLVIATIGLFGAFAVYGFMLMVFLQRGLRVRAALMCCYMLAMVGFWLTAFSAYNGLAWGFVAGLGIELVAYLGFAMVAVIAWRRRAQRGIQRRRLTSGQS